MKRDWLYSLRTRLTLSYLILGVLPLLVLGYLANAKGRAVLTDEKGKILRNQAAFAGEILDRNLFERYGDVQVFAAHPDALAGGETTQAAANYFTKAYSYYDLMLVVDRSGKIVGCNTRDYQGKPNNAASLLGRSVSEEPWFRACINGEVAAGKTLCGDFVKDPLVATATGGAGDSLRFSAPIFDKSGRPIGVWSNSVSWSRLVSKTMEQIRDQCKALGMTSISSEVFDGDPREDG